MDTDDMQDHYYIDVFNLMDTSMLRNGGSPDNMEGTQRLYTTKDNGDLDKCILIAPYIDPLQYVGRNLWSDGAGSPMDKVIDVAQGVMSSFNTFMQDMKSDTKRTFEFLNAFAAPLMKYAPKDLETTITTFLNKFKTSNYKAINMGEFKKQYQGTSVEPPITSLSVTYFSNPGDFGWFQSRWQLEQEKTPLRKMCAILLQILLGDIVCYVDGDSKDAPGSLVQFAPMNIQSRDLQTGAGAKLSSNTQLTSLIKHTFAIAVSDHAEKGGAVRIIRNLLPESITITPSRILTRDDDYYYVKIDVTFSLASYIGASDIATLWIAPGLEESKYDLLMQGQVPDQ